MTIWYSLLVPIIAVVFLYIFYKRQTAWWEYVLPIAATTLFIVVVKALGEHSMTKDTEYWGSWVVNATKYEDWNERVSCSHARYRTETRTRTDSKGNVETYTEHVFDGWEHPYDVSYHPEEYWMKDSLGEDYSISEQLWLDVRTRFANVGFVEMNRAYHTIDGDAYRTSWSGDYGTLLSVTTEHNYENRIKNSDSVFNYRELKGKELEGLYDYVYSGLLNTPSVLPRGIPGSSDISKTNALLGSKKEVRVWILVYFDKEREIAKRQEVLWKNGNMNELVICVGVNKQYDMQWAEVFGWTKTGIKANLRTYLESQSKLDLKAFTPYLNEQIESNWVRRDFSEFNYLSVKQPTWAIVTAFILALASSAFCVFFAINNEFTLEEPMK